MCLHLAKLARERACSPAAHYERLESSDPGFLSRSPAYALWSPLFPFVSLGRTEVGRQIKESAGALAIDSAVSDKVLYL